MTGQSWSYWVSFDWNREKKHLGTHCIRLTLLFQKEWAEERFPRRVIMGWVAVFELFAKNSWGQKLSLNSSARFKVETQLTCVQIATRTCHWKIWLFLTLILPLVSFSSRCDAWLVSWRVESVPTKTFSLHPEQDGSSIASNRDNTHCKLLCYTISVRKKDTRRPEITLTSDGSIAD